MTQSYIDPHLSEEECRGKAQHFLDKSIEFGRKKGREKSEDLCLHRALLYEEAATQRRIKSCVI